MINRLYIDNYKCFVNFEWQPGMLQLILGENGTGKTTVFDILETLREIIVSGLPVGADKAFPTNTLTAWDTRREQRFELAITGNGGQYDYHLTVEHDVDKRKNRIKTERLTFDQFTLYEFDGHDAHLFRDNGSAGPIVGIDWCKSFLSIIPERDDNKLLAWFRRRMQRVYIFSPDPLRMSAESEAELEAPDRRLHNLVSWIRHLWQESIDTSTELRSQLREGAIGGLRDLKLELAGEPGRVLKLRFACSTRNERDKDDTFSLSFKDLSDGQRCLIALYTMLVVLHPDTTLCVDEPDNFVALREIQPWLTLLRDRAEDNDSQCLLVSHHPELINYLAAQHGSLFFREDAGPVRMKRFEWTGDDVILPSEIVARGWE